ncbi:MAG TPA: beta-ketoacyl synthase N-terminal-like domain-containing protein, partial [Pyrinomonadaceae bacterium]
MNGAEATHLESEIAIIGMSGRFPGAGNVSAFWDNLLGGVETITTFTDEELIAAGEDPQAIKHPDYVKARGV